MDDLLIRPCRSVPPSRLAGRVVRTVLCGFLALFGAVLVFAAGAVLCAAAAWEQIGRGAPLPTVGWVLAMLACLGAALAIVVALLSLAPQPWGVRVPRDAAPALYALVDALSGSARVGRIRRVYITSDMNAAVVQRPFLFARRFLVTELLVGLPLAHSLSPGQFAAVIAHEIGHVVARQGTLGGWGAYLQAWWMRTVNELSAVLPPWLPWVERHGDRLCRAMVGLARREELAADEVAAQLVGSGVLGEALVEVCCKARFLADDYLPLVHALAAADRESRVRPFRDMGHGFAAGFARSGAACDPEGLIGCDDGDPFHPPLRRRLQVLGVPPCRPSQAAVTAAEHYFGGLLPTLAWAFDQMWWEQARVRCYPMASAGGAEREE
jgi:Zn-dependent protease with chaperone function